MVWLFHQVKSSRKKFFMSFPWYLALGAQAGPEFDPSLMPPDSFFVQ
jgi:hypothetical protein